MRAALLLLGLASCGAPLSSSKAAVVPAPPLTPAAAASAPPAVAAIEPLEDLACERVTFPAAGASVLIVPGPTMTRALLPVVRAACSCTRPGQRLHLTAVILPEAGVVRASAHDDEALDRCLQATLEGRFAPPFEIGSDCIGCGPKRFPGLRGSAPPAPLEPSRITFPFTLVHL
ncbi:MAG: hypothetical protein IPF92_22470 [Myxococcales bacterium]|jgi:hypothetical protein|nr:hypothetical protein [Myxococcales bacterium]MBL0194608.1 hypothetical protein [Myxococcales bacterium]HQY64233.1 hypothetical protein [Polyangiaceae bacterium]